MLAANAAMAATGVGHVPAVEIAATSLGIFASGAYTNEKGERVQTELFDNMVELKNTLTANNTSFWVWWRI